MAQKLCSAALVPFLDANGDPYVGAKLFTYVAGSSTKTTTTKDLAGASNHANPIILNASGMPGDGSGVAQAIWQPEGVVIKLVLAPSTDTDPPVAAIRTYDNISGINDTTTSIDEWVSGNTPTFIDATSFSLVGDQTSDFHVGRRLKLSITAGTTYATIITSAYTALTTITIAVDETDLDSGLSAVWYGLLSETNHAIPRIAGPTAITANTTLEGKHDSQVLEVSGSSITLTLTDAATLGAGWNCRIKITGTDIVTLTGATTADTYNGTAFSTNTHAIATEGSVLVVVNASADGFLGLFEGDNFLANRVFS